jgi:hypothetical protein
MDYLSKLKGRFNSIIGNYAEVEFVINGHRLTAAQMDTFQRLSGLPALEAGRYWLNPETGAMGHEGEQAARTNIFRHYIRQSVGPGQRQPSATQRRQPFNAAGLAEIWNRIAGQGLTKLPAASGHGGHPETP